MKTLVICRPAAGVSGMQLAAGAEDEMATLRRLRDEGLLLEAYWPGRPGAILIFDVGGEQLEQAMASLPFVRDGLLEYERIPLRPFSALG